MVKLTTNPYWHIPQQVNPHDWITQLPIALQQSTVLNQAIQVAYLTGQTAPGQGGISCWQQGISMVESLLPLNVDDTLLAATILYPVWQFADLSLDDIQESFPHELAQLIEGAAKMDAIDDLHNNGIKNHRQIENCRKMLLAMAKDLRVVLLKFAERLHALRTSRSLKEMERRQLGEEVFAVYAPLANRLGIGQLKWELEDLAFRAIDPERYKSIAKQLDMRRIEREQFIQQMLNELKIKLQQHHIHNFELMGRAKHIYSIYKKIKRKNIDVNQLYDISAVRVLVKEIDDCYQVLDIVQQSWSMIPHEFDDYISTPKPNGYRSIHTAVIGPGGHTVEIQIRTFAMHQESELGVAAHWRYKEGGKSNQTYEAKIAWLREILSWQGEVTAEKNVSADILADRVYVLTPQGDIVDLPQGATSLDFAYYIHTNIGHRCRGAKINGHIVPLTTPLKMTDRVEILTGKEPSPSRDWINPHLAYLTTARARAKVAQWFREQDFEQHADQGKTILEKELKRFNLNIDHDAVAKHFNIHHREDFYAALGNGDLKPTQLYQYLEQLTETVPVEAEKTKTATSRSMSIDSNSTGIMLEGVGNLLTHTALCCQPLPGDNIAGYISPRHGVAIHRHDCVEFLEMQHQHPERILHVGWGEKQQKPYPVSLIIEAHDRAGLTRDITQLLGQEKLNLLALNVRVDENKNIAYFDLQIQITSLTQLAYIMDRALQIPNVIKCIRKNVDKKKKP